MKNLIDTLKNIWKIEELRNRILTTLGFLLIYRLGSFVALPGIDPQQLGALQNQTADGLLGLLNMFTGGAFSQASIMALGIMPYISASIVIQLATMAVPYLQKLQKDGESGRTKISQITRYLTVLITCFQAPGYIANLKATLPPEAFLLSSGSFWFSSIIILVTGTMFAMWLGEKITDSGIGNGISLLIMVGIIASLPQAFLFEVGRAKPLIILVELVIMLIVILASVLLVQGVRRIPIQYAKRGATAQIAAARQYLPLKVNASGVMPIIFAQAIMFAPAYLGQLMGSDSSVGQWMQASFSDMFGLWYNILFGFLIIVFTYFYTAITVPTNKMSDDLKRSGGFVPGIRPGSETSEFLDKIMSLITFPGSIFLAALSVLPAIVVQIIGMQQGWALFYGGTSLLIMVGVAIDTIQQINAYLLNRHYDGLMKTGKKRKLV